MTSKITQGTSKSAQAEEGGLFFKSAKDKTILLLGSGALKIGEAGEFDYSGSQAIKAFKEEGARVVLVNPNIATNQTSWNVADTVYFLPVNPQFVKRVIEKEKPDVISLSFGGQTALNCGLELNDSEILKKNGIAVLGTPVESIRNTEDRALFNAQLKSIDVNVPASHACEDISEAFKAAEDIGFPVIVRGAFALGGKGSGRANDESELKEVCKVAFVESPQILVEEDLTGWKEIEYEVVRDRADNCITVCNMENIDPLGIHTGESIVIAPSQTLDNTDYQMLRSISLKVIRHLGIIGECNIQFALDPDSRDYRVIEVNARLSRSSALASKATGYPLAFIAAKLSMDYTLPELSNAITHVTCADFEPSLDYVAIKMPRWDMQKFRMVSNQVTSEMKSVGEVMALGKTFEEAMQKAIRMLNIGAEGLFPTPFEFNNLGEEAILPTPRRIFAIAEALKGKIEMHEIHEKTKMDMWFLERIRSCALIAERLKKNSLPSPELLKEAKRSGFSDRSIAMISESDAEIIRKKRIENNITPVIKQVDTLAGEFPAQTNYLYMTYHGTEHDIIIKNTDGSLVTSHSSLVEGPVTSDQRLATPNSTNQHRIIVLGGGPYSIGSSVEFDWCCVQAVHELQKNDFEVAMINSNPETVSTDYDECDLLFFEELSEERVRDIADLINPYGIVVSMGGQIPNSLAPKIHKAGLPILGTAPEDIDRAEDRHKFSTLLDELKIDQPEWKEFSDIKSAKDFAQKVAYPVIVRPSYVLSGASMAVVHSDDDLEDYVGGSAFVNKEAPIVVSKFEIGAKEIEFDGVAQDGKLLLYAISEHIENAGVHSGDATIVLPP
ncbi:carbamoyl-phosphate synthase large subunit, partial [Patescibacteria group bacterium]|nr:carbamoyl-phosphate synthase large subunit [Patescibacteria group bacterium]